MWAADCDSARGFLDEQGVWVCDGAVSEEVGAAVRQELLAAYEAGMLTQSGNKLALRTPDGNRGATVKRKPNVFEADVIVDGQLERPEVVEFCPVLGQLLAAEGELRMLLNAARPELALSRLEQAKVQVNTGNGGAFPFHFDVSSAKDARRHLTALLYFNPAWKELDGGEVETLPFPFDSFVVEPLDRRLVVFSANSMMHRVRPFAGSESRVCMNLWFEGGIESPFPVALPAEDLDARVAAVVRVLRGRPLELRAFCKAWYRDEIADSFRDAFEPCKELEEVIALHFDEAAKAESREIVDLFDGL
eukprot:gnl/TRDRNA2_/TRDRNA2_168910_c0_seq2.p1 gnl/TRDRNA2_/TRDRNA2_168910_c0~~gnl/TRDRNA2_/TRDRNA2_168910_c0_seq2.p1  ORF type:complete len:305 (+),score=72.36 gnl/TRDRNA2_/TRDRNA2_168910_c0_seq2:74-988(+)